MLAQWVKLKQDVKDILNGQLDGTAAKHRVRGAWNIVLKNIAPEYQPLSTTRISSVVFICAGAHKNEQNKFIEDLRKGCSNLVEHKKTSLTVRVPFFSSACAQMRRSATAPNGLAITSPSSPRREFGLILLYQAAVVTSDKSTSIAHYFLPILGPQLETWAHPAGKPVRRLSNLAVLIGVTFGAASRKVIQTDGGQIPLDDAYVYQRGDIYRFYRFEGPGLQAHLSNPAPRINIHAEIGDDSGSTVLELISPETGELRLLP